MLSFNNVKVNRDRFIFKLNIEFIKNGASIVVDCVIHTYFRVFHNSIEQE